jgi:hypothetical protein
MPSPATTFIFPNSRFHDASAWSHRSLSKPGSNSIHSVAYVSKDQQPAVQHLEHPFHKQSGSTGWPAPSIDLPGIGWARSDHHSL